MGAPFQDDRCTHKDVPTEADDPDAEALLAEARDKGRVLRCINAHGSLWDYRPIEPPDLIRESWVLWTECHEHAEPVPEEEVRMMVEGVQTVYSIPIERSLWGDGP